MSLTRSRSDRPALYQEVASALSEDLCDERIPPGGRLPSERALAQRFGVNRQTVRQALHLLRERGLVLTAARGSYAAHRPADLDAALADVEAADLPHLADPAQSGLWSQGTLRWEECPPAVGARLDLEPGCPALTHHHTVRTPDGEVVRRTVTRFSHAALDEVPELGRQSRDSVVIDPDLRHLYPWMCRAGLSLVHRESVALRAPEPDEVVGGPVLLAVRRDVSDQHGHVLEATDLLLAPGVARLTYEFTRSAAVPHLAEQCI